MNAAPDNSASSRPNPPAASGKGKIKVALVEDRPGIRNSWSRLINSFPDFACVCTCKSAEEALKLLPDIRPDVVLMDIFLPRMSGIECTTRLKGLLPATQVVMLTAMKDEDLVFMALEAGADGFLLKRTEPSALRAALLEVLSGGAPMTSEIARVVIERFRNKPAQSKSTGLSVREEQILQLLSRGYANKTIADQLKLSVDTVCTHLKHVFEKLHVNSRTEAAVRYLASKPPAPNSEL